MTSNPNVAVVRLSDLTSTGRMDAPFHIAMQKHKSRVMALISSVGSTPAKLCQLGRAKLDEALSLIPPDDEARYAVARGSDHKRPTWKPTMNYTDTEVALYLAIATRSRGLEAKIASLKSEIIETERKAARLKELLGANP